MTLNSSVARANGCLATATTQPPARLLAEAMIAVRHTLGTGSEEDNRALDGLERELYTELRLTCREEAERTHWIGMAMGTLAPPGAPSCRHAARLLRATAERLRGGDQGLNGDERARMELLAARCAEGAAQLERIAQHAPGSRR